MGAEPVTELALAGGLSEDRAKAQGIGVHLAKMKSDLTNYSLLHNFV